MNLDYILSHSCVPVRNMDMPLANKVSVFCWNPTFWQNPYSEW